MKEIGKVTHFFDKIDVAVIELVADLNVGDVIYFKGSTTDFSQKVDSMQIEHKEIQKAGKGEAIGLKVDDKVRVGDGVFLEE